MELISFIFVAWLVYLIFFKKKGGTKNARTPKKSASQERLAEFRISASTKPSTSSKPARQIASAYEDDDDLATFRISYGHEHEVESKNKTPGRWVRPSEKVNVAGHAIPGGFYYFGGQLKSLDGYEAESSLIDSSLPVDSADIEFEDDSLGYWPKYIRLSPEARGAYLTWLSGSRNESEVPIGYVFIYFYGLERRALVDALNGEVDDEEFREIFAEVRRLRSSYGENRSFSGYSMRLLEMMILVRPEIITLDDSEIDANIDPPCSSIASPHASNLESQFLRNLRLLGLKDIQSIRSEHLPADAQKSSHSYLK